MENTEEVKPKKKRNGAYAKRKGNNYELKIIKELIGLGYKGLKSSRSESKNLDDAKIDIAETEDKLPCYVQCKCTKNTPSIAEIIKTKPKRTLYCLSLLGFIFGFLSLDSVVSFFTCFAISTFNCYKNRNLIESYINFGT
mgnify:CR=1 FL=1